MGHAHGGEVCALAANSDLLKCGVQGGFALLHQRRFLRPCGLRFFRHSLGGHNAALDQLASASDVPLDAAKLGAIGFCFGGATALELARSGADIAGVVSFHGNLGTDLPARSGEVKAKVLAINGGDDQYVPAEQINAFTREMAGAGVDWQFVNLGGAVHCFAEADAQSPPGCVYNERAAKRAFRMMRTFFAEAFAAQD